MANNMGITIGTAILVVGVVVLGLTVPLGHTQTPHVLKISASPNAVVINSTTTEINISVNYSYSYQNPEIRTISPTVKVTNESTGVNLSYDILGSYSATINTGSFIKTTQTSSTTIAIPVNPGAYKVMGNGTYQLKIIIQDPSLTFKYGLANVTILSSS